MKVCGTYRITLPNLVVNVVRQEVADFSPSVGFSEVEMYVLRYQTLPAKELAHQIMQLERVVEVEVVNWDRQGIMLKI